MAVLPDPQDIAYQKSHPDDDMTDRLIVSTVVCSVLSIFAVMLRLYARHLTKGGLGKDDYMMLLALVVYIVFEVTVGMAAKYGTGRHIIYATDPYHLGVYNLTAEVLNSLLIPVVETSVLLFYDRLFPQKRFRTWLWIVASWVWLTKIAFIVVTLLQCIPISTFWTHDPSGHCLEFYKASMAAAVFNVVTNLIVLLMPVPLLWRLKMQRKLRLQVIFAFTIGALTCIAGFVRIAYTPALASFDLSWNAVNLAVACTIEGCLFVISGCIPTYVVFLTHFNRMSRTQRSTNEHRHTRTMFSKSAQEYGISSFVPRGEKWTELNSINNPSETDHVKITTNISTTYEPRK